MFSFHEFSSHPKLRRSFNFHIIESINTGLENLWEMWYCIISLWNEITDIVYRQCSLVLWRASSKTLEPLMTGQCEISPSQSNHWLPQGSRPLLSTLWTVIFGPSTCTQAPSATVSRRCWLLSTEYRWLCGRNPYDEPIGVWVGAGRWTGVLIVR